MCLFDISYFELEAITHRRGQEQLSVPSSPLCLQQDINPPLTGMTVSLRQRGDGTGGSANGPTPGVSAHTMTWKPKLLFRAPPCGSSAHSLFFLGEAPEAELYVTLP